MCSWYHAYGCRRWRDHSDDCFKLHSSCTLAPSTIFIFCKKDAPIIWSHNFLLLSVNIYFSWSKCAPSCFLALTLYICCVFIYVLGGVLYIFMDLTRNGVGGVRVFSVYHHNPVANVFILNMKSRAQWQGFLFVSFSFFFLFLFFSKDSQFFGNRSRNKNLISWLPLLSPIMYFPFQWNNNLKSHFIISLYMYM